MWIMKFCLEKKLIILCGLASPTLLKQGPTVLLSHNNQQAQQKWALDAIGVMRHYILEPEPSTNCQNHANVPHDADALSQIHNSPRTGLNLCMTCAGDYGTELLIIFSYFI